MSNERETQKEIRRIVRMLEATTKHLERASLLDTLSSGEARCIRQFNNALARLNDLEALPEGLFEPLDDSASVGDIGYAYHQVATYLKDGMSNFDFDFDFKREKETIGNVMKDVGDVVARNIFSMRETDSEDDESSESTIESVEIIEDDEKSDPVEPRLDKLEEQLGTVVEILQELQSKKNKKDKKDGGN